VKKTTFNDARNPLCEKRKYTVHRTSLERPSSIVWYFYCPWCGWSLSGGGKRCPCGAIFGSMNGYKLPGGAK